MTIKYDGETQIHQEWNVPQLSIMIFHNNTGSIVIQWMRVMIVR